MDKIRFCMLPFSFYTRFNVSYLRAASEIDASEALGAIIALAQDCQCVISEAEAALQPQVLQVAEGGGFPERGSNVKPALVSREVQALKVGEPEGG